jgi:hypothetical protein
MDNLVDGTDGKLGRGFMSADKLEEVDIGNGDKPRPTFISASLESGFREELIKPVAELEKKSKGGQWFEQQHMILIDRLKNWCFAPYYNNSRTDISTHNLYWSQVKYKRAKIIEKRQNNILFHFSFTARGLTASKSSIIESVLISTAISLSM